MRTIEGFRPIHTRFTRHFCRNPQVTVPEASAEAARLTLVALREVMRANDTYTKGMVDEFTRRAHLIDTSPAMRSFSKKTNL